ncbi:MAG TPA: single-stranded DNA-binding protein [Candidatus Acidoferrales bacterium]|nr:single-stranded DNA-binding protein [Candidatus Acidoferrales bacterium]
MAGYNKVILVGNLTRDPELRYTPSGLAVCEFSLAVRQGTKQPDGGEEVCFVDIVAFGRAGEASKEHLRKGARVLVDGRLTQRRWETPEGRKRSKYEIVAGTVQFLSERMSAPEDEESAAAKGDAEV